MPDRARRFLLVTASIALSAALAACGVVGRGGGPGAAAASVTGQPPSPAAAAPSGLTVSSLIVPAALASAPFDVPRQVLIPRDWTMTLWTRLPEARLAAWAPDRALLVSRPEAGEIVRLVPNGRQPPTTSILLSGLRQPHGLAFDGDTLYVARSDQVDAYHYADGQVSGARTVIPGLPDKRSPELHGRYTHALKSVAIAPDKSIYVSIGSTGNISSQDRDASPERAAILRVPPGGGPPEVFAHGVRNGTGLAIAPDGSLWTAVNNTDNVAYPYPQAYAGARTSSQGKIVPRYVADHPPEELARLTPGRDLGWPFCNPDPDVQPGVADSPQNHASPRFVPDAQTNANGVQLDCTALPPIERTFGAHSAPLGLSFTTGLPVPYGDGALVAMHGSWNRTPPRAPEVSYFPWLNGTLGDQQTLVGGFQLRDSSRWGRPVAAVRGTDGAIYITDDHADAVYLLVSPGP